jgi:hypothetical protein
MQSKFRTLLWLATLLTPIIAHAQDAATEDKLRNLLRQTTEQLRAAQDNAATVQAQLDAITKQRDALQAQLAQPQAPAAPAGPSPEQRAAIQQAQAQARAAQTQAAAESANTARWQKAYTEAAAIARAKDQSDRRNAAGLNQASAQLTICKQDNARLIDLSGEILHLYETPQWNQLLVANHDRLLGFARVKLQNLVQDYEDKTASQEYIGR